MDNLRGIALMIAAMAVFAVEDMFVKAASASLPTGQIILGLGLGGGAIFAALAALRGQRLVSRELLTRPVLIRNAGEALATMSFVTALSLVPISVASAILQATPLAVTAGAALFLGAPVGWRRWAAVVAGFLGVLLILRPGFEGFRPAALFAVIAVFGLAARDLATRAMPARVTSLQLSAWGFATLIPAGLALLAVNGAPAVTDPRGLTLLAAAIGCGAFAYYAIVAAMRVGEIAVVTPFRYTRILFALLIGYLAFSERPDALTLAGAALIVASGLYTLLREARLARAARRPAASPVRPATFGPERQETEPSP